MIQGFLRKYDLMFVDLTSWCSIESVAYESVGGPAFSTVSTLNFSVVQYVRIVLLELHLFCLHRYLNYLI